MSGGRGGARATAAGGAVATGRPRAAAPGHGRGVGPDAGGGSRTGTVGETALLDRVVRRSLAWLDSARDSFRLPADVTTGADPNLTLKPLGELAELACAVSESHPCDDVRRTARALFAYAWNETRDGELFVDLIRGEPFATYPVEIYGVFARAGLRHPGADRLLRVTTGLRGWRVARDDPTRTLAVLGAERRIGLRPPHADFGAVLEETGLGRRTEPWAVDRKAAYGITHDVLHLTDWGRRPLPSADAGYLRLWVPAWAECWMDEQLWDLAGELLAVAACLPVDSGTCGPRAWRRFAEAQAADGSVPLRGGPRTHDPRRDFAACYHSTLVTAFAATLARTAADTVPGAVTDESEAAP